MSCVRLLGLVSALVALSGCYRWSAPLSPTAPEAMQTRGGELRVTPQNGPAFRMVNARITADTLRGDVVKNYWLSGDVMRRGTVALPLSGVRSVALREFSRGRTVMFAGAVTVAVVAVVVRVYDMTRGFNCFVMCGL